MFLWLTCLIFVVGFFFPVVMGIVIMSTVVSKWHEDVWRGSLRKLTHMVGIRGFFPATISMGKQEKENQTISFETSSLAIKFEEKTVELTQITCYKIKSNVNRIKKIPVNSNFIQSSRNQSNNHIILYTGTTNSMHRLTNRLKWLHAFQSISFTC